MARSLDPLVRRGELLDGAFALFAARGYHALSVRDLARELGVTTGALYHWFVGKPELFAAMLERQVARQVAEALAAVGAAPKASPDGRMAALGAHVHAHADDLQRTLLVALDYLRAHPERRPSLAGALASYRDALVLHVGLPPENAGLVVSLVLGELVQRALDPDRAGADLARLLPIVAAMIHIDTSDTSTHLIHRSYGRANAAAEPPATRPPQ